MPQNDPDWPTSPRPSDGALPRWDNEGGAGFSDPLMGTPPDDREAAMPAMGDAEMGALHIRVIALENLVIALLADASDRQHDLARAMARYIAPREGSARHPLTIHAAAHMIDLVERSMRFRSGELPQADDIA